jgi:hypothetical protein
MTSVIPVLSAGSSSGKFSVFSIAGVRALAECALVMPPQALLRVLP